jgi:WD40 repeat protein
MFWQNEFQSKPIGFKESKITINKSRINEMIDNTFCAFTSVNNILCIVYAHEKSILFHNLIDNKTILEIQNAHKNDIINFRHYFDQYKKRDLISSLSIKDLKIWDATNFECLFTFMNEDERGLLFSSCFLNSDNQIYVISSNCYAVHKSIKVFDLNGNKIKEMENINADIFFIDSYYDKKKHKNYILTANQYISKSFDFEKNELYHEYNDNTYDYHYSLVMNDLINIDEPQLIESSTSGEIKIWNFHSAELIKIIKATKNWLVGTCLWNKRYLLVGSFDYSILTIDLENEEITKTYCDDIILTIKKIFHPIYGESILFQGNLKETLKLLIK